MERFGNYDVRKNQMLRHGKIEMFETLSGTLKKSTNRVY